MAEATIEVLDRLDRMLVELEGNYHEVVLVPAEFEYGGGGRMLRALQSANAVWYQKFNQQYTSIRGRGRKRYRRARTYIKRQWTLDALTRMLDGDFTGVYAERLLVFVEHEIANEIHAAKIALELEEMGEDLDPIPF